MLLKTLMRCLAPQERKSREARFACSQPVRFGLTEGHILDVSAGGMRVLCQGPVPRGTWMHASLQHRRTLRCRVVWTTERAGGTVAGLKFDMDAATRESWLKELVFAAR